MPEDPMDFLRRRAMELREEHERERREHVEQPLGVQRQRVAAGVSRVRSLGPGLGQVREKVRGRFRERGQETRPPSLRSALGQAGSGARDGLRRVRSAVPRPTVRAAHRTGGVAIAAPESTIPHVADTTGAAGPAAAVGARLDLALRGLVGLVVRVGRWWPWVLALLAVLLWWPVGFAGRAPALGMPGDLADAAVLAVGALASGLWMGFLVRELPLLGEWTGIVLLGGCTAVAAAVTTWSGDPAIIVVEVGLAIAAGFIGLALGSSAGSGLQAAAAVLALLAALSGWPPTRGPALAVALTLPMLTADLRHVGRTVTRVVRVLLTWFVAACIVGLGGAVGQVVPDGALTISPGRAWAAVADAAAEVGLPGVRRVAGTTLADVVPWLWLALVLSGVLVVVAVLLALADRQAEPGSVSAVSAAGGAGGAGDGDVAGAGDVADAAGVGAPASAEVEPPQPDPAASG